MDNLKTEGEKAMTSTLVSTLILTGKAVESAEELLDISSRSGEEPYELSESDQFQLFFLNHMYQRNEHFKETMKMFVDFYAMSEVNLPDGSLRFSIGILNLGKVMGLVK